MPSIADFALQNLRLAEDHPGVWIVTLNRPEKRDALNAETIEELVTLFFGCRPSGCAGHRAGGGRRAFLRRA